MAGYLIAEEGPLAGLVVRLEEGEEWILGRDPDEVSIVLEDPMVSRKHVICRLTAEGYILENLSSVNPATQNGKVITEPVLLRESDILQIGSTFFRFSEKTPSFAETFEEIALPSEAEVIEEKEDLSSVNVETGGEVRWFLKVISGPNSGAEFAMQRGSTYILGKDPNLCDIVFQDLSVSRQHARLIVDDENMIFIEDLGSRNGVLINGELITEKHAVSSQDLVALGTTSFLMIDREQIHETIISPPSAYPARPEEEPVGAAPAPAAEAVIEKKDWREMVIPKKHLVLAGFLGLAIIGGLASMMALFRTEPVVVHMADETESIKKAIVGFDDIQFSYNPSNGKVFLVGHVLTSVDKQELLYKINNLSFIKSVEDNVVIDEYVWDNMNALLMTNPDWVAVSLYSPMAGKFILRGYLQTLDQMQALVDYMNVNFPYLDKLENQVVIETNLETQVQSMLIAKGYSGVTFQISNGEIVLAGRVDQAQSSAFSDTVDQLKSLKGIRVVKNFVVYTTADTSRIDVSAQYKVSGYSKKDDQNMFIVINGKIMSVGDTIDGMTITGIQPSMVLLEKDGLKFRINYNLQ
ncbi:MAG: type III secretion system inner membrane ring subunit SctD [Verrucomicrobia bacterium]|nr:type III secretion system inner membrane ring subunit SctD [Verrucomicrobiota bacterium]